MRRDQFDHLIRAHDLAVAKLIAGREHDYGFCRALISSGLVAPDVIRERLAGMPDVGPVVRNRVVSWLEAQDSSRGPG